MILPLVGGRECRVQFTFPSTSNNHLGLIAMHLLCYSPAHHPKNCICDDRRISIADASQLGTQSGYLKYWKCKLYPTFSIHHQRKVSWWPFFVILVMRMAPAICAVFRHLEKYFQMLCLELVWLYHPVTIWASHSLRTGELSRLARRTGPSIPFFSPPPSHACITTSDSVQIPCDIHSQPRK